ncbi:unnamed protein product [Durusdinium trenchii]|uniref:Acyl carrier protein n=1 Tax=Durusdinium trenchii TaxID=1381693 RepID=A0ABP0PTN2_9DINO
MHPDRARWRSIYGLRITPSPFLRVELTDARDVARLRRLKALTFVGPASPALRAGRAGRASLLVRRAASDETMGKVAEEKVTREATLTELGADSLDIVESVMALEEAFDIELPDEETTPLKNCGDVMESRVMEMGSRMSQGVPCLGMFRGGHRGLGQGLRRMTRADR